jgi:hypothetical protein
MYPKIPPPDEQRPRLNRQVGRRATDDFGIDTQRKGRSRSALPTGQRQRTSRAFQHRTGSQVLRSIHGWDGFRRPSRGQSKMGHFALAVIESKCHQVRPVPFERPLKELGRSSPSEVMFRNSISATNRGSTQVTFSFLMGLVSLDLGLTTVSSCLRIWLETVRDRSDLAHID